MTIKKSSVRYFSSVDKDFDIDLKKLLEFESSENTHIDQQVGEILENVK